MTSMASFTDQLLSCAPNLQTQLTLLFIWAGIWYFFIPFVGQKVILPWIRKQPWCEQFKALQKSTCKQFGVVFENEEDLFKASCNFIPVIMQHGIGGFLCLISIFNLYDADTNASLACMGGLIEAGWEFQDSLTLIYIRLFGTPEQKATAPNSYCILMGIHHASGLGMVIPMNIMHRDDVCYHELVFLLQFAAAVSLGLQNYGYTLDIKTKAGLFKMQISTIIAFIVISYSRVFRFIHVLSKLVSHFYSDGDYAFVTSGVICSLLMGIMNLLMFLDAAVKVKKFLSMSVAEEATPEFYSRVRSSSTDFFGSAKGGHNSYHGLSKPQKRWAKVKGAVRMGVLKAAAKANKKKSK